LPTAPRLHEHPQRCRMPAALTQAAPFPHTGAARSSHLDGVVEEGQAGRRWGRKGQRAGARDRAIGPATGAGGGARPATPAAVTERRGGGRGGRSTPVPALLAGLLLGEGPGQGSTGGGGGGSRGRRRRATCCFMKTNGQHMAKGGASPWKRHTTHGPGGRDGAWKGKHGAAPPVTQGVADWNTLLSDPAFKQHTDCRSTAPASTETRPAGCSGRSV
jgi:hypothetical protein